MKTIMNTQVGFLPVAEPVSQRELLREMNEFQKQGPLARQGALEVYLGSAPQMSCVLHEIGRLRELSFRAVGEGTGQPLDTDEYDAHYLHLFLWDAEMKCIAGAYRIGRTDHLLAEFGPQGLLTATHFQFEQPFLDYLNPGLELGRAFVAPSHQKSIFALSLLWKGIACFVSKYPRYARLFGTVSISDDYTKISQDLIVKYMRKSHMNNLLCQWVTASNPYQEIPEDHADISAQLSSIEQVAARIAEVEPDGKGVPVLLRQYLKLNATLLEFNVDADFGNCLDALVLVDLRKAPSAVLMRYMGKDGLQSFLQS
ncbi:hypothetical protein Rhal01_02918 [Rubritalea halochordaticola]|uniref:GNAT family N-acetyltransferase n=1 Tax=Rubritalea halochordaticola TaxID=714537 RepID=A0ABP9V222_9BACT